jgi:predicted nucleic acid-binding protein
MQVLVDTSVWSLALRRAPAADAQAAVASQLAAVSTLRDLIADGRACMLGAIRQELLSGIKTAQQFNALRTALQGFEDIALTQADYEKAAEFFNICRSKGVQGSNTDFLICAASSTRKLPILTNDQDFVMYAKYLPIQLLRS